ncbi:hypothetical protein HN385_02470 [archaeon]|jgi:hypothetical protein|nr:hypothetical protein [archaeon]MBT3450782.1 hypothetical protein [archaeon]MBT6868805.1 hypothetical protein [archaeon]MBT7192974.1 hypothetical protein [archaeon]MBT7380940.1 hypothetical protein [archaeon]
MTAIVTTTLEDAIRGWERIVKVECPLFQMPVVTVDPDPNSKSLWSFATDCSQVMANLYKPVEIDKKFETIVAKLYQTAYGNQANTTAQSLISSIFSKKKNNDDEFKRTLSFHNSLSLLIHELFHPRYMPDSTKRIDEETNEVILGDKELIHKAIYEGIKEALPTDSEKDLLTKTRNVENAVWDFCIDTFQYYFISQNKDLARTLSRELKKSGYQIDGKEIGHFPEGVIPIFDVVSYSDQDKLDKSVIGLNRYTYSLLFCGDLDTRKNLLNYFGDKIRKGGVHNIENLVSSSLKGIISKIDNDTLLEKGIVMKKYQYSVDQILADQLSQNYDNQYLVETMTSLFMDKKTRYDAIKGFIKPLAHLITVQNYEQRGGGSGQGQGQGQPGQQQPGQGQGQGQGQQGDQPGQQPSQGDGGNSSGPSDLGDVLDAIMNGMDQNQQNQLLNGLAAGGGQGGNPNSVELQMLGRDKYYKLNSPDVSISSPDEELKTFDQGKIKTWEKHRSIRVPANELHKHHKMIEVGLRNGLPVLIPLVKGKVFVVNYFKKVETHLESYCFQSRGMDIADNLIFINDSSGSMGGGKPGGGSSWDGLMHVEYGVMKTLYQALQQNPKPVSAWVGNFSNSTYLTGPHDFKQFYESAKSDGKRNLLIPQGGVTNLNTRIFDMIKPKLRDGRTVWNFITDGGISNSGAVYQAIESLTRQENHCFLYFDMFCSSSLGGQLKQLSSQRENVRYFSVRNMQEILKGNIDVLIKYK